MGMVIYNSETYQEPQMGEFYIVKYISKRAKGQSQVTVSAESMVPSLGPKKGKLSFSEPPSFRVRTQIPKVGELRSGCQCLCKEVKVKQT